VFIYIRFLNSNFKLIFNRAYLFAPLLLALILSATSLSIPTKADFLPIHTYSNSSFHVLVSLIAILLIAMIAVVKITESFKGSLVKKF